MGHGCARSVAPERVSALPGGLDPLEPIGCDPAQSSRRCGHHEVGHGQHTHMAVEGSLRCCGHHEAVCGSPGQRRQHAVGDDDAAQTLIVGLGDKIEHPSVVAPEIDDDQRVAALVLCQCGGEADLVADEVHHIGPQCREITHEGTRHTGGRLTGDDGDSVTKVGEVIDQRLELSAVETLETAADVAQLDLECGLDQIVVAGSMDALRRRFQFAGELASHLALKFREPLEAQFRRRAHHGRRSGAGRLSYGSDRPEGNRRTPDQEHLGHASLCCGQGRSGMCDAIGERHRLLLWSPTSRTSHGHEAMLEPRRCMKLVFHSRLFLELMFQTSLAVRPPIVIIDDVDPLQVPAEVTSVAELMATAGRSARRFPPDLYDALVDFGDDSGTTGALLLRNLPVGTIPPTPPTPTTPTGKSLHSEALLLAAGRLLGQPVGYAAEHGGDLVQNIVPMASTATRQISTSSRATLLFHTETAFHPHRPRYLLLLCLRGDPAAQTTLTSSSLLIEHLAERHRAVLFQARFRTALDESHRQGAAQRFGPPRPVFEGDPRHPTMVFDADLMVGTDDEATEALEAVNHAVATHHLSVTLESGDLLVIDNFRAIHGRGAFVARFDGTDRWLQRTFVVSDLAPSAGARSGRILAPA